MKVRSGFIGLVVLTGILVALGLWLGTTTTAVVVAGNGFPPCCDANVADWSQ